MLRNFNLMTIPAFCLFALLCLSFNTTHGSIVTLAVDAAQSDPSSFGGAAGGLINDGFAYDPANPTAVSPDQQYNSNGDGWHGNPNGGLGQMISFTFGGTIYDSLFVDLYGRNSNANRDDVFTIEFYNGGWAAADLTESIVTGIPGVAAPFYARETATATTQADRIKITNTGAGAVQNFTLMEFRVNGEVAAVPEPSSLLLLSLGAAVLVKRRRR